MKNEIYLSIVIAQYEDITHETISEQLGLTPSKVFVKGERMNPNSHYPRLSKQNVWRLDSGLSKYHSFEEHMDAMFNIIEPRIALFTQFAERYYCEFSCSLYVHAGESTPSVHLGKRYSDILKKINIEFDLDLYLM